MRNRAAASSIASGIPSSAWQIRTNADKVCASEPMCLRTAPARSNSSRTAGAEPASEGYAPAAGSASGSTCHSASPVMPSGSLLVARIRSRRHPEQPFYERRGRFDHVLAQLAAQHRSVQRGELGRRVDAQLLDEPLARPLVDGQGLSVTTRLSERAHQRRDEPLRSGYAAASSVNSETNSEPRRLTEITRTDDAPQQSLRAVDKTLRPPEAAPPQYSCHGYSFHVLYFACRPKPPPEPSCGGCA